MIKITIFGLVLTLLGLELKQLKAEYSTLLSIAGGIIIFSAVCINLSEIIKELKAVLYGYGIKSEYLSCIIKIIGTAYLAEFSCGVCKDAGFNALASQIEVFSKLYMLTISMPIVFALLNTIDSLWG